MFKQLATSPSLARTVPFFAFVVLTSLQGRLGPSSAYWLYGLKTLAGLGLLWMVRPVVAEMRWAFSWEAVVAGAGVFFIWIGLDGRYPPIFKSDAAWNPQKEFEPALAWVFVTIRIGGSTLVVPALEEVFYRSFLYRYLVRQDFLTVVLGQFSWMPFLATSVMFGMAHREWLPGIICGLTYQALVCRKKRLGDAMTAHAITNFLLGLWVIWKGAWHFW